MNTFYQRHGRRRPPQIWDGDCGHDRYEINHPHVLTVLKDRDFSLWAVWSQGHEIRTFDTHAEAIAWAQKHARQ